MALGSDITEHEKTMDLLNIDEKTFRSLYRQSVVPIAIVGLDGKPISVNDALCKFLGYSRKEIMSLPLEAVTHPDDYKKDFDLVKEVMEGKKDSYSIEKRYIRKDGKVLWGVLTLSSVRNHENKIQYFISIIQDFSEHKKIEDELDSTFTTLSALIENSDDATLISDKKGRPILWNKTYARIMKEALGIDMKKGLQPHKLLKDKNAIAWWDNIHRRVLGGESFRVEYVHDFGEKGIRWFEVSYRPIFKNKDVTGFTEFTRDISERKKTEAHLMESEELFKSVYDQSPVGIELYDPDGNLIDVNAEALRIFGIKSADEVKGFKLFDDPNLSEKNKKLLMNGKSVKYEGVFDFELVKKNKLYKTSNSGKIYIEASIIPLTTQGKNKGYLVHVKNITDRKTAEFALKESEETHKLIFKETPIGIVHINPKGIITACNPALADIMGAPIERILGLNLSKRLTDKNMRKAVSDLLSGVDGYFEGPYESVVAGRKSWLKAHFAPINSDDEQIMGGIATFEDISLQKITDDALRDSEEKFRALSDESPNIIFINQGGRVVYVNQQAVKIMGYTREEFYSPDFDFLCLIAEESREMVYKNFAKHGAGAEVPPIEYKLRTKDGKEMIGIHSTKLIDYEGGKAILGIVTDITDRKKIEDNLKKSEALLNEAQRIANIGSWTWNLESDIVQWSDELYQIAGLDSNLPPPPYKKHPALYTPESWKKLSTAVEKAIQKAISYDIELDMVRPDGEIRNTHTRGEAFKDESGKVFTLFGTVQDITKQKRSEELLKRSEKNLITLSDSLREVVFRAEPTTFRATYVNKAVEHIFGIRPDDWMKDSDSWYKSIHPDDREKVLDWAAKGLKLGKPTEFTYRIVNKKKGVRWVESHISYEKDHKGKITSIIGLTYDITERRKTEKELELFSSSLKDLVAERTEEIQHLKEFSENIIETTPMCVVVVDKDLVVLNWNKYSEDYVGLKKEAIVGKKMFEVLPSLKKLGWEEKFRKVIDTGKPFKIVDYEVKRTFGPHKGETWYQNIEIVPIYVDGEIQGALELLSDVTAKKKAEIEVLESEEKYRDLIESAQEAIFTIDPQNRISSTNSAWTQLTGFSKKAWIGKDLTGWIHPEEHSKVFSIVKNLKSNTHVSSFELQVLTKNGYITCEFSANILSTKGKFSGVSFIGHDITSRKKAEDEMKRNLMKYDLKPGKIYLAKEPKPALSREAFKDILKIASNGLVISRYSEDEIAAQIDIGTYDYFWMSEEKEIELKRPLLSILLSTIRRLEKGSAVLIDRLDYLIMHYGFKEVISFVQRVSEIALLSDISVILSIDPGTVERREMRLLEKEGSEIEALTPHRLPEALLSIMRTVYNSNMLGIKPSHTAIGNELNVSRPTIRKRIRKLVRGGYILEHLFGREKILELTDKGYTLFRK